VSHFACGAIAGCAATTASYPFDVVRTRLIGQGEPKVYRGLIDGVRTMYQVEGVLSLYKGFLPTLLQIAPNAGFTFAFYKLLTGSWSHIRFKYGHHTETKKMSAIENLICGGAAGMAAKILTYPLDVIKKRLQVVGFDAARSEFGALHTTHTFLPTLRNTVLKEGLSGMYKGLCPSIFKAVLSSGLSFLFYEETCRLLTCDSKDKIL